jgi:uncharacterized protein (TIGR00369 family)
MTERTLTVRWEEPTDRFQTRDMSGLEFLQAIVAGRLPRSPMSRLMNYDITEASEGRVVVECVPDDRCGNFIGIAHGGLASTLLDSCMGASIQSTVPAQFAATTLEIKVNMVRPITPQAGKLVCEGKVIHSGRRIATAEGRIVDAAGRLYAHGTTTMMIFPLTKNDAGQQNHRLPARGKAENSELP